MNAQAITEITAVFLASVTAVNLLLNFLSLLIEEYKKCSIIDRDETKTAQRAPKQEKFRLHKKRQYAVLNLSDRTA